MSALPLWSVLTAVGFQLVLRLPFLAVGLVLELLTWPKVMFGGRRVGMNLAYTAIYLGADMSLSLWAAPALLTLTNAFPGAGLLTIPMGAHPSWLLIGAAAVAWLAVRDLCYYVVHRAQHQVSWLWAIHQLHHSDPEMNVTTTTRVHWLEAPLRLVTLVVPISYLFQPTSSLLVTIVLVDLLLAHFVHVDLPIGFGWWNRLIPTPQTHRIHHSALPVHRDKNFAPIFPLWDVLFGTYYAAQPGEYPATGLIAATREPESAPALQPSAASV